MKRRRFLSTSVTALGTVAAGAGLAAAADPRNELYELRVYSLKPAKQGIVDRYLGKSFLPALRRAGIGSVGAFMEKMGSDLLKIYVLIVHPSADSVATLPSRLAGDATYVESAKEYLDVRAAEPAYARIDSSLLAPIAGMPGLARPDTSRPRLFNLRIYESHNERAALKKIEMFNSAELAIFRRVGLTPVFFAATLVGSAMPNLTYMLVFPDDAGRQASWSRFRDDPEWKKIRAMPEYADKEIVSRITNKILQPLPYSEI